MTSNPVEYSSVATDFYRGGVAFEDLTARARIREAALTHFASEGYERATIRGIAQTAGVSPGLLRHHYGSKEALREACDAYVFEILHRVNTQLLEDPLSVSMT
jgi:TetR/AcrR family transcriptional regulator, regulator of cefoperazone and chloramphenicol sensitivity